MCGIIIFIVCGYAVNSLSEVEMKKVGLLLSGGISKGAYQIGALEAVTEYFDPGDFCCVSASSIGVLNTYSFITGNLSGAKGIWNSINPNGENTHLPAMLRSDFLQETIMSIIRKEPLAIPFYMPLWNIKKGSVLYSDISRFKPGMMYTYMRAGVAMPIYNRGVEIDGATYYDGGLIDNIPIYPVSSFDMDYIICMYFDKCNYIFESYDFDKKVIKINFPSDRSILDSFRFNHAMINRMMIDGRNCAKRVLDTVFADGVDNIEAVRHHIQIVNARNKQEQKPRLTGDVVVNNLDKFMLRYAKRKIVRNGPASDAVEVAEEKKTSGIVQTPDGKSEAEGK